MGIQVNSQRATRSTIIILMEYPRIKICPECGGRHKGTRWGTYCSDSCVIEARAHGEREDREYDKRNPSYSEGKLW